MTPSMLNLSTATFCPLEGMDCPACGTDAPLLVWVSPYTDEDDRFLDEQGNVVDDVLLAGGFVSDGDYAVCAVCAAIFAIVIEEGVALVVDEVSGIADEAAVAARVAELGGGA
jgi:hypothetical protein